MVRSKLCSSVLAALTTGDFPASPEKADQHLQVLRVGAPRQMADLSDRWTNRSPPPAFGRPSS